MELPNMLENFAPRRMLSLSLLLASSLQLGCTTTDVVVFDSISRLPVAEDKVEILLEKPGRQHNVIARIQFGPDAFMDDYQSQTNEVVRRAAELGADAVIISYDSEVVGYAGSNYGATGESKVTIGQAIIYANKLDGGT